MDRTNILVCALGAALVLGFAGIASAQDETTEQVDWADAATYAELMDEFVSDDDVAMETYYDEAQNVLWSQPAALSVEEATAALAQGAEQAMLLDTFQWIVPTSLWLCDTNDNCDDGTNYKFDSGDIYFEYTAGTTAFFFITPTPCTMASIDRIEARGQSSTTDYCDATYVGQYYEYPTFYAADEDGCGSPFKTHIYWLVETDGINAKTYSTYDPERVAAFHWHISSTGYRSEIWFSQCII